MPTFSKYFSQAKRSVSCGTGIIPIAAAIKVSSIADATHAHEIGESLLDAENGSIGCDDTSSSSGKSYNSSSFSTSPTTTIETMLTITPSSSLTTAAATATATATATASAATTISSSLTTSLSSSIKKTSIPTAIPATSSSMAQAADDFCPICLEGFTHLKVMVKASACRHSFCKDCILTWGKKNTTCPLCKSEMDSIVSVLKESKHCRYFTSKTRSNNEQVLFVFNKREATNIDSDDDDSTDSNTFWLPNYQRFVNEVDVEDNGCYGYEEDGFIVPDELPIEYESSVDDEDEEEEKEEEDGDELNVHEDYIVREEESSDSGSNDSNHSLGAEAQNTVDMRSSSWNRKRIRIEESGDEESDKEVSKAGGEAMNSGATSLLENLHYFKYKNGN